MEKKKTIFKQEKRGEGEARQESAPRNNGDMAGMLVRGFRCVQVRGGQRCPDVSTRRRCERRAKTDSSKEEKNEGKVVPRGRRSGFVAAKAPAKARSCARARSVNAPIEKMAENVCALKLCNL